MSDWTPSERDDEVRRIRSLTRDVAIVAVGATVVMGVGIAWGDQQRIDQADGQDPSPTPASSDAPTTAPTTAPSLQPGATPTPTPTASKSPKSKSGGS